MSSWSDNRDSPRRRQRPWDGDQPSELVASSEAPFDTLAAYERQIAEQASESAVFHLPTAAYLYRAGIPLRRIIAARNTRPVYIFLAQGGQTDELARAYHAVQDDDPQRGYFEERVRHFTWQAKESPYQMFVCRGESETGDEWNESQGRTA